MPRKRLPRFITLVLLGCIAACAADPYPLLTPAGASQFSPTRIGEPVRSVVLYLQPRPGDRVELISAEAVGQLNNTLGAFFFSPPVFDEADGTTTIGEKLEPLEGAVAEPAPASTEGPGNDVGIVLELTPLVAGRFTVTAVRLSFRLNGGPIVTKEGISQTLTVCAGDPQSECEPDDD